MKTHASMKESMELLRQRFQAEMDIELDPQPADWEQYAKWIEKLAIKEVNRELVQENEIMRKKMQVAMKVLEQGLAGAYVAQNKRRATKRETAI